MRYVILIMHWWYKNVTLMFPLQIDKVEGMYILNNNY